ncbi:MAG: type VI secretion system Vgr family protein [Limisphaerales bacterium]
MPGPTQQNRFSAIDTQLGADKLLLRSFSISEQLGRLFQMEVELDSQDNSITFEDIIGTSATVRLTLPNGQTRYFNGVVSRFAQEQQGNVARYRTTLMPWLWLLTRTADCRIFQNQKVPDIIEAIFKEQGFDDYKLKLNASYDSREYCVQYRETDFNFVSRLMEEEGIYYFFDHQNGKHVMVLADSPSAHDPFPGYDTLNYLSGNAAKTEAVADWIIGKEIQPGMYVMNDFNFTTPSADVTGNANITRTHQHANYEVFEYPGGFEKSSQGEAYAKLRIQELQAQYEILHAQTTVRGVATGFKFTLKGHPRSDQNRQYLVIGTSLRVTAGAYGSGDAAEGDFFSCALTAIPATQQFRALRATPKPQIHGPQTAIVTGPNNQEINTDQYGRVQVQFHWDRSGQQNSSQQSNQGTSCWIRVSQIWAGKQWGSLHIPRIGQEVIVEFLEGDPDHPIVTGSVYNASQMPPYTLPANQTQSGIRSRSTTGGGASNFNELHFEDKKGSEQIFIQAEKDLVINVKNDRNETIGQDRTETVSGSHKETISNDRALTVSGKETKEVDSTLSLTVSSDVTETFNAGHTEQTSKAYSLQADTVAITGQSKITLTVGSNSITIDSSGITISSSGDATIKGTMVKIN